MKKLITLLLTLVFVLGLTACTSDNPVPQIPSSEETESVVPAVETRIVALKGPTGIGMAKMMEDEAADPDGMLSALAYEGRDDMGVSVFGNDSRIILTARFDNLGKGASGAAIQNMNLLLGLPQATGLCV